MGYLTASGPSLFEAAWLGQEKGASWVGVMRRGAGAMPLDIGVRLGTRVRLTDLWRAPDGGLWVVGEDGAVRRNADPWGPDADQWEVQALDAPLHGITGVDGRCVLARGVRERDGVHVLRVFNGARWNPLGGPGFALHAVHPTAHDRIWVGGEGVARWDGTGWEVLPLDPGNPVVALHAPADDRVLVALADGHFGRVTPDGLSVLGQVEGAQAIAVWRDRIWIGAGANGLWRAGGGSLEQVRADRRCLALEAHPDGLLVACEDLIASSHDGEGFPGGARGHLEGLSLR